MIGFFSRRCVTSLAKERKNGISPACAEGEVQDVLNSTIKQSQAKLMEMNSKTARATESIKKEALSWSVGTYVCHGLWNENIFVIQSHVNGYVDVRTLDESAKTQ